MSRTTTYSPTHLLTYSRVLILLNVFSLRFLRLIVENAALRLGEPPRELLGDVALAEAVFLRDLSVAPQVENVIVQHHHAVPRPGLNRRGDAENLVFAYEIGDAG